jgi:hypothetical protein
MNKFGLRFLRLQENLELPEAEFTNFSFNPIPNQHKKAQKQSVTDFFTELSKLRSISKVPSFKKILPN